MNRRLIIDCRPLDDQGYEITIYDGRFIGKRLHQATTEEPTPRRIIDRMLGAIEELSGDAVDVELKL
jgi:hypothetical protein